MGFSIVLTLIIFHEVPRVSDWQPAVLVEMSHVEGSELTLP